MAHDPTLTIERHSHETAHWILVPGGPYRTTARGAPAAGTAPLLIYNPAGTTHRDGFQPAAGHRRDHFFSVAVSAPRMASLADQVAFVERPTCVRDPGALAAAARLVRACARWDAASPLLAEGLCLELMAAAVDTGAGTPGLAPTGDGRAAGRSTPVWLRAVRELLHDRSADALAMADVARTAGVHAVYLARAFRRAFGCSPGEYQRRCRLERSAALLAGGAQPLSAIALQCGFGDHSHFSRAFRRAYGVTPATYRRLICGPSPGPTGDRHAGLTPGSEPW